MAKIPALNKVRTQLPPKAPPAPPAPENITTPKGISLRTHVGVMVDLTTDEVYTETPTPVEVVTPFMQVQIDAGKVIVGEL